MAGGGADVVARIVKAVMGKRLGKSVVKISPRIDGGHGVRQIALSQPDGYTVGLLTDVMTVTAPGGTAPDGYEPGSGLCRSNCPPTADILVGGGKERSSRPSRSW